MPSKKATPDQYRKMAELIRQSEVIKWGKGTPEVKKLAWEEVSQALNAIGGAEKSWSGWKKAFIEWKSHIKMKIRSNKKLSDSERECAEATGLYVSCQGLPAKELGVEGVGDIYEIHEVITECEAEEEITPDVQNEELEISPETVQEIQSMDDNKKQKSKKHTMKTTKDLLDYHINSSQEGLLKIATAIQSMADALNNIAEAIKDKT